MSQTLFGARRRRVVVEEAAYSPFDIPSLRYLWTAKAGLVTAAGVMTSWTDQKSGVVLGSTATGTMPLASSSGVIFDGVADNIGEQPFAPSSRFNFLHNGTGMTMMWAMSRAMTLRVSETWFLTGGTAVSQIGINIPSVAVDTLRLLVQNGGGVASLVNRAAPNGYAPAGGLVMSNAWSTAAGNILWRANGVQNVGGVFVGAPSAANPSRGFQISSNSLDLWGTLYELHIFDAYITPAQMIANEAYLRDVWSI